MSDSFPDLLQHFTQWLPVWKALGFFVGTFILEDVATAGAGLLLASGAVTWPTAFWGCFLGIWGGDAGLYALARLGGRKWFERSTWRRFSDKVGDSERWFSRRGIPILIFSRLLPGARLPTYLAAGFLRVPAHRFLFVTGIASLAWTLLILLATQFAGLKLMDWLHLFKQGGLVILGILFLCWTLLYFGRRIFSRSNRRNFDAAFARLRRWEFWPAWMFYLPVALYCFWLALKYRGLALPTLANPGIFAGGVVGESKISTLGELMATSPDFTAPAGLVCGQTVGSRMESLEGIRERLRIDYPFILKPDVGQRGAGVKLIRNPEQARAYLEKTSAPLLLQRYIPGPYEAGILYYRFPDQAHGRIFAITEKVFPVIIGDGHSTVSELIWRDPRARLVAAKYLRRLKDKQDTVLVHGQSLRLVEAGNHAAGCIFRDGLHLCSTALTDRIDAISGKLTGFYFGRYDIRYSSPADLHEGRNFQIVELNGATSEATSIYDVRNSLWTAYQTLFKQWDLVFAIGAANRARGFEPTPISLVWRKWREYAAWAATYPATD
jgi:membrane protein DedA with SNARE-associated domain